MCGRATLTMVASSTTISCAVARTSRARPGRGPPAAATPPGAAARAVLDRISDMTGSPGCVLVSRWHVDLLLGARADFGLAPHMAGAGLVSAAANSGSRAR